MKIMLAIKILPMVVFGFGKNPENALLVRAAINGAGKQKTKERIYLDSNNKRRGDSDTPRCNHN